MPLYIGNDKIKSLYIGDQKIKKAYVGEELVYSSGPEIPPHILLKYIYQNSANYCKQSPYFTVGALPATTIFEITLSKADEQSMNLSGYFCGKFTKTSVSSNAVWISILTSWYSKSGFGVKVSKNSGTTDWLYSTSPSGFTEPITLTLNYTAKTIKFGDTSVSGTPNSIFKDK